MKAAKRPSKRRPGSPCVSCRHASRARRSWRRNKRSRGAKVLARWLTTARDDHQLVLVQRHRLDVFPEVRASLFFYAILKASAEAAVEGVCPVAQEAPGKAVSYT